MSEAQRQAADSTRARTATTGAAPRSGLACLLRPPAVECFRFSSTSVTLPLGLAYVAAAVEASGRPVHLLDAVAAAPAAKTRYLRGYLLGLPLAEIVRRIPADAASVGISVIFTHEWPAVVRLVELIERARPELPIVLGGEHVTSLPEFCLMTSRADALVLGEGEETIVELLDALEAGASLAGIAGAAYRDGDGIVVNPRRARRKEIDEIPLPAWHLFDVDTYNEHRFVGGMDVDAITMPILATRGCPYQCTYCSAPNMWTPKWIARDPKLVADEIESYIHRYGARNFPFQDLTAILNREWIIAFCRELLDRELDIVWQLPTGTRAEAIDREVAELLRRSGNATLTYAPETGSETTRRWIKKRMHTDTLLESIRASVAGDLNVSCVFVIGFPHDTPELIAENLPFLEKIAEMGVRDAMVFYYMALPGTELFHSLYDAGEIVFDRDYFTHILHGLAAWPSTTHNPTLGRLALTRWKFQMTHRFYNARRRHGPSGGLVASARRALSGLFEKQHDSRLQTAFRNGIKSAWYATRVRFFGPRWLSADQERALFEGWDEIYREIRGGLQQRGVLRVAPSDTRELHTGNVIRVLRNDHEAGRRLPDRKAAAS